MKIEINCKKFNGIINDNVFNAIVNICNNFDISIIKTSGNIFLHLSKYLIDKPYKKDRYLKTDKVINIYNDLTMKWEDNRIIPIYNTIKLRKFKIDKITKKNKKKLIEEIKLLNLLEY
jgi:hypothetical protein